MLGDVTHTVNEELWEQLETRLGLGPESPNWLVKAKENQQGKQGQQV